MSSLCRVMILVLVLFLVFSISANAETWKELLHRADSLSKAQNQDSAIVIGQMALEKAIEQFGEMDTNTALVLYRMGEFKRGKANYEEAESLHNRALAIREIILGPDHLDLAVSLNSLANLHTAQGRYAEAESLHKRALAIKEKALGPVHPEVASSLNNLANLYLEQGNYREAEPLYKRALAMREKALGPDHLDVAANLVNLAIIYNEQSKYAEAESLYKRALSIEEKVLGPHHPDVASSLHNLACCYADQGKYTEAEPVHKRALAIKEKTLGPDHPGVARSLINLAVLYYDQAKYAEAEPLYKRALLVFEEALGPDHLYVALNLDNLGALYTSQGKYAESEALHKRALAIREKNMGPDHSYVARSVFNLACLYGIQGKYREAEPLFKRALSIFEKDLGPDHPDVARTLDNLAAVYSNQNRYRESESLYKRALAIREKALGPDHQEVAGSLYNLAALYAAQDRYREAEPLYRQALSIQEKALGPDHPHVASSLDNLACWAADQDKYTEAEPLHKRALSILEKALGPDHPDVAKSLNNLANLYRNQGKYEEAEPFYKRTLSITKKSLGPDHPGIAECLESFSQYHRLLGDTDTGMETAARAFEIRKRNFQDGSSVMSESDALTYSQFMRQSADNYLSCYLERGSSDPGTDSIATEIIYLSKGVVSDGIFERRKSLAKETDSTTLALAECLRFTKFQLSQLYIQGPGEDVESYRSDLDSLSKLTNDLEADVARLSASFRKQQDYKDISIDRISSLLPEKSVLVEYLYCNYLQLNPDSTIPHYLVVVLAAGSEPVIADLGGVSDIHALISDYREHMLSVSSLSHMPLKKDRDEYESMARKLYDAIIRPVEDHLSGMDLVVIAPDGGLNLISFAGLIDDEGRYLIEKYPIHYLSSGRDLVRLKDQETSSEGLLALGDPDYDAIVEARLAVPDAYVYAATEAEDKYRTRNVRSGCGDLSQLQVEPLPHSRREIELVAQQWSGVGADSAIVFFGPTASEDHLKAEASGKRVIHLATHGYFLEGRCNPELQHQRFELDRQFIGENPLLLSGLLFAGSNLHGEGADSAGVEDGVLSAYEVSAMNLEGTDLVVLSACETGLGEVKQGEGVYGLRRAFQMTGARTVVSALWPVSDKTTADMMAQLYAQSEKSLPERIREVQLAEIRKLRSEGFSDHPYNWAAFIALGDWR